MRVERKVAVVMRRRRCSLESKSCAGQGPRFFIGNELINIKLYTRTGLNRFPTSVEEEQVEPKKRCYYGEVFADAASSLWSRPALERQSALSHESFALEAQDQHECTTNSQLAGSMRRRYN